MSKSVPSRRCPRVTEKDKDKIVELYNKYGTMNEVQMRSGRSSNTVKKILKERDVIVNEVSTQYKKDCLAGKYRDKPTTYSEVLRQEVHHMEVEK